MAKRRIVITGMGLISSLGEEIDTFWQNILAGKSGVSLIRRFDTVSIDSKIGGECFSFNPENYIDRKEIKRLDRFAQFALSAAILAARHAGISAPVPDGDRVGVIIGSGIGGLTELEEQHIRLRDKGPSKVSAFTIPKLMVNAAPGNISLCFGARGINTAVATACASATNAMGDALRAIQRNDTDVMFTGGSEAALTPLGVSSFCAMKALSTRNDEPHRASRPFDRDRDGFVMGEGAGILIFEELEHAKARNATIYGEVIGFGASADAYHLTAPEPDGKGAAQAMIHALTDAGIQPTDVDYINAHGTSTSLGDIGETRAVKKVFGSHAYKLAISSTKSQVGHLLGASGGVELITTLLGMRDHLLPPTINLENPDPECDLDYVPNHPKPRNIHIAMSNSFGFGGHNACIVVKKYE
ncbi:MAG: beta-ketoacyl-ACP synthase II [Phycisphaerae bacterium]